MDDIELKGNSFKQKAEAAAEEETKREPVVKGVVKQKKKSAGRQFVENFVNEDGETIKTHILFDIIVPTVKDMISSGVQAALDMLLYGEVQGRANRINSNGRRIVPSNGQTNYNAISQQKQKKYAVGGRPNICDDILFEDRSDATQVLDDLTAQLDQFGVVSCYDLYDAAGLSCDYTLKNWGWYDLNTASVQRTREGDFIINLPKPLVIK